MKKRNGIFRTSIISLIIAAIISSLAVYSAVGSVGVASASTATVTVNATGVIRTIDKGLYGVYSAAWDELAFQKGAIDENFLQTVKDAKITLLRYPGGAWGNAFDWTDPAIPSLMTTDQFMELCQEVGAEPTITINVNESVELAENWVRYCNIEHDYNVKYWELHDEPWYDGLNGSAYAAKINQFAPAMKAIDNTILIGACVSCRYPSERSNTNTVVKNAWQNIDFYNHNCFFISPTAYNYDQRQDYYDELLYTTTDPTHYNSIQTWFSYLVDTVNKWKDPAKPVEYMAGSYNSIAYYPADWMVNYLPEGLWVADLLGAMIEDNVITKAAFWHEQNPYPVKQASYGYIAPDFRPYVSYYAIQLYTYFFGDTFVSSTSSTEDLSVYASTSTNKLHLILINKDPLNDITTTFTLQNWTPKSTARAWILDGPTEPDNLPGRVLGYGLRTEDISNVSSQFTWTVPSYSAVAIELPNSQGSLSTGIPPHGEVRENTPPFIPPPGAANLALGKTATASTIALSTEPIDYSIDAFGTHKALDNDATYTRWASKIWWETNDYPDITEWFKLDLGAVTTFDRITIKWGLWATTYSISVSNNGQDWTQIATRNDATLIKPEPQPWDQIDLTTQNARYIKLNMTNRPQSYPHGTAGLCSNAFSIWEFEVYNTGGAPPDNTPPVITNVASSNVTHNSATITWNTNELSDSVVRYGTTTPPGSTKSDAAMVTSHSITLTNLSENTTYYYEVQSTDASSNTAVDDNNGSYYKFTTTVIDTTPPAAPTGLTANAVSSSRIDLDWNNNTENDLDHYHVYRSTTSGFPCDNSTFVAGTTVSNYSDTGLTENTTYYYKVTAVDTSSNESNPSNEANATTPEAPSGPTMHVLRIDMELLISGGGSTYQGKATVYIVDENDAPVPSATVKGHWEGIAPTGTLSNTTDSGGAAPFWSPKVKNPPSGSLFIFVVENVTKTGWTYDPNANIETRDNVMVP